MDPIKKLELEKQEEKELITITERLTQITKKISELEEERDCILGAEAFLTASGISLQDTQTRTIPTKRKVSTRTNANKGFRLINLKKTAHKYRTYYRGQNFSTFVNDVVEVLDSVGGSATTVEVASALMEKYPGRWKNISTVRPSIGKVVEFTNAVNRSVAGRLVLSGQTVTA